MMLNIKIQINRLAKQFRHALRCTCLGTFCLGAAITTKAQMVGTPPMLTKRKPALISGAGFENATDCILNGNNVQVNTLFPNTYISFGTTPNLDIMGNCNNTYGLAFSGSKFLGIGAGDALTIDLGANLTPGATFTVLLYERMTAVVPTPASYKVGLSTLAGAADAIHHNLVSTTGTTNTTWTVKILSFTVPAGYNWRYLTLQVTSANGWTHLDY